MPASGQGFFGLPQIAQGQFPAALQLSGDQTVIGIDPIKLALGQGGLIAQPLDLLRLGPVKGSGRLLPGRLRLLPGLQLGRRHRLEERSNHPCIDRIRRQVLADRRILAAVQGVADVAGAALVLDRSL